MQRIRVIDSHTGGEPTRVVIEGGPELGTGSLSVGPRQKGPAVLRSIVLQLFPCLSTCVQR